MREIDFINELFMLHIEQEDILISVELQYSLVIGDVLC